MLKLVPVRIGSPYQAEIPELLPAAERQRAREEATTRATVRQQWASSRVSDAEVLAFLQSSCRLNEAEEGLRCLHEGDYDVNRAASLLQQARHRRLRGAQQRQAALTDEEFETAVQAHGKKFFLIKQHYPEATTSDLVARFYEWKTSTAYTRWRERVRARRNKEAARLRQWTDTEESEASDFHNEYCDLCCTGGQLLCCDGCERAYHFSCVTPPIKDVPMGDWFCKTCAAILGASLKVQASAENAYCDEIVVSENSVEDDNDEDDEIENGDSPRAQDDSMDVTLVIKKELLADVYQEDRKIENDDEMSDISNGTAEESLRDEDSVLGDDDSKSAFSRSRLLDCRERKFTVEADTVTIKNEPVSAVWPAPRAPLASPTKRSAAAAPPGMKSPLPVEAVDNNRKRQRKIGAPRRIPQSHRGI